MTSPSSPDWFPDQLLADYVAIFQRRRHLSLANTVIRQDSAEGVDLVAAYVLGDHRRLPGLLEYAKSRLPEAIDFNLKRIHPVRMGYLARLVALRAKRDATGLRQAADLYDLAAEVHGTGKLSTIHQDLRIQVAYRLGDSQHVSELLDEQANLSDHVRASIELNLANPVQDMEADWSRWLGRFEGLLPPAKYSFEGDTALAPIDRLRARGLRSHQEATRVTVAFTCFRPGPELLTAVRSVVEQSWRNLEILLLDDGSGEDFHPLLKECAELDERIKLVLLERNQGTYAARNAAIDLAEGEFLTFHDSDDWSHPDRIERQLTLMRSEPSLMATTAVGLKVRPDLLVDRLGQPVVDSSLPTTMLRLAEVRKRVGYFHQIRRGADAEYLARITAAFGRSAVQHEKSTPVGLMRQSIDSLSGGDFGAGGWMVPAREAYKSAYAHWHSQIKSGERKAFLPREGNTGIVPVAPHLLSNGAAEPDGARYDFVFATDWRPYGAPAKSTIEEIVTLLDAGYKVGIFQLETYRYISPNVRPLCSPIQQMVNDGRIDRLLPGENHEVGTLVIRYPSVLQFPTGRETGLRPERVVILANQAPREHDGTDWRYVPSACTAHAKRLFGVDPIWVPQGPQTRQALIDDGTLDASQIAAFDMPSVVDPTDWAMPRRRFRSALPVLGRHSRDHYTKWPDSAEHLLQVYPDDPAIDVRIMGGDTVPLELLGQRYLPPNWTSYSYDQLPVKSFLYQLDFWIYFHHPVLVESFGRAVLEAMANGCVVVLPHSFEPTFGPGAVYCREDEVHGIVTAMHADFARYQAQSERGLRHVREQFSRQSHLRRIARLHEAH
ncbi:glycosyltransferase [Glycomyces buryatensis]|uniref:Glycosyltransferase n=1 Tax=Glycomyces buryatensis TaxID=2570927 RepID=A0A4S8QPX5_9ACTN|nr:glycosyltransferase [Glycomyces buryatensis]THV43469.1 glycosyltransferase [Glycomyces buryatensis]